jgi:hypothetical protein
LIGGSRLHPAALRSGRDNLIRHPAANVVCSFVSQARGLPQNSQNRKCADVATQINCIL